MWEVFDSEVSLRLRLEEQHLLAIECVAFGCVNRIPLDPFDFAQAPLPITH